MGGKAASQHLRLLACQISIPPVASSLERDTHLQETAAKVRRQLSLSPADLVVLPELSSIDYSRSAFEKLAELSEPLDGASFAVWSEVARAHKTHIAYSFPRQTEEGFCISLGVVGPAGDLLGYYDKLHLAQCGASMEKEYFQRGKHLFVFDLKGFRVAPIICLDIRFPELTRALVVNHGADLILHMGAYYRDRTFYSWHQFATSRAIENQVFLLSLNRAGINYGESIFCPPWMDQDQEPAVFPEHDETFQMLAVSHTEIEAAREINSFLADRFDNYDLPVFK